MILPAGQIKTAMKKRGLRQEDVARALNVRRATVSDWLTGKQAPHRRQADRLAALLGLEPARNDLIISFTPEEYEQLVFVAGVFDSPALSLNEIVKQACLALTKRMTAAFDEVYDSAIDNEMDAEAAARVVWLDK